MTAQLLEGDLDANPYRQFDRWFTDAKQLQADRPDAMTLATAASDGTVSARMVLLKGFDERGFTFFTNYNSRKGEQLHENPRAALVFFWPLPDRQVRIEGAVVKVTSEESDSYFSSRARGSQLGAWSSEQSSIIAGRGDLEARFSEMETSYRDRPIPRPPHWGGFRVIPLSIEFWQGRSDRMHDRFRYRLRTDRQDWVVERLSP
jgi:pyridoxamine 5'-phosphate oxidase